MEEQPTLNAPEPKPQKTAKKTALFAKLSIWFGMGGIVYLVIGLKFLISSTNFELYVIVTFVIIEIIACICAIIGFFQIAFSKSMLTGSGYIALVLMLFIIGAIVIPNFLLFNVRAKQNEAKQNLGAIFTAYQTYHNSYNTYPTSPSIQVGNTVFNCLSIGGWEPKGLIRYNYNCMNVEAFSTGKYAPDYPCPPGIITRATKDTFTIAACGNLDNDSTVDVWTINDQKRLKNVVDDVKE